MAQALLPQVRVSFVRVARLAACLLFGSLGAAACGPATGAVLEVRGPTEATVGEELRLSLRASTEAVLGFEIESWYKDRPTRPTLTQLDGEGTFRFTPLGDDVGPLEFTFTATQAGVTSRVRWPFEVVPPAATMVFRQPLGAGTTFDPTDGCVDVPLAVDHAGAASVTFEGGDDWPESAAIEQTAPLVGSVHFCPTADDLATTTIFPLSILATDPFANVVEKRYVLVAAEPAP